MYSLDKTCRVVSRQVLFFVEKVHGVGKTARKIRESCELILKDVFYIIHVLEETAKQAEETMQPGWQI